MFRNNSIHLLVKIILDICMVRFKHPTNKTHKGHILETVFFSGWFHWLFFYLIQTFEEKNLPHFTLQPMNSSDFHFKDICPNRSKSSCEHTFPKLLQVFPRRWYLERKLHRIYYIDGIVANTVICIYHGCSVSSILANARSLRINPIDCCVLVFVRVIVKHYT